MTAETLKPFITPTSAVNNFPAKHSGVTQPTKRKIKNLIPIVLCIIAVALVIGIFGLTIWQTTRVQMLESDLACLKREVESLRKRLGINYLEDMNEFQKEYSNMLIQDPSKLDDIDVENEEYDDEDDDVDTLPHYDDDDDDGDANDDIDDDDDDSDDDDAGNDQITDYNDYLDMIKEETNSSIIRLPQNSSETHPSASEIASESASASNDDNVFADFKHYDSKKKAQRKSRSIELRNELQSNDVAQSQNPNGNRSQGRLETASKESSETAKQHTSHRGHRRLRPHSRQARQRLLTRKGESPVSARSGETQSDLTDSGYYVPAAHFHLTDKIDNISHKLYIGKETANTDTKWKEHFSYNHGHLRVIQPGLYYVYAQICYENRYDENGFVIYHENKPFLNCLNTVPTNMKKLHTCHTSGLIQLKENESIQLRPLLNHEDHREILREDNNRSYIGIIKLHGQV